jgi:hypothetical protein
VEINVIMAGMLTVIGGFATIVWLVPENRRRVAAWLLAKADALDVYRDTETRRKAHWHAELGIKPRVQVKNARILEAE